MINKSRFVAVIMTGILMAQAAVPSMVYAEENTAELNGVTENLGVDEISETNEGELNEEMPETEEIDTESDEIEFAFGSSLRDITDEKTVLGLVYLTEVYEVKSKADLESDTLKEVETGQTVQILDAAISPEGAVWYQVGFYMEDEYFEGYIEREFVASSDEELLAWERENLPKSGEELVRAADGRDIQAFPNSYRAALSALKSQHPNWTFVKMNTNLDWNTVIRNELGERSLIYHTSPDSWKNGKYSNNWYYASEGILKYYMDPRNFLTEQTVFQFEQLTYNATYHTQDAVQNILKSTFMNGIIPDFDRTYAQTFYEIGRSLKVSPFHLACRVYQEQGRGTSPLISGNYPGYEGLYNYFNIGASGNTQEAEIRTGLEKARAEGWTTRYKSLEGGANIISKNYILKGQDTLYLQKFDVDNSFNGLYWHQYMQNIEAPYSESSGIRQAYIQTGSLNSPFVFKIPVYNNMPESVCGKPADSIPAPTPAPVPTPSLFPFTDVAVNPGNWKYESVKFVYEKGIMAGMTANTFAPDGTLTRGMFAAVLYRMSGSPQVVYEDRFVDVPAGKWYSDAVVWASKNGIVRGFDDSHFAPDSNITREQMARMLRIYAQIRGCDNGQSADISGFADAGSVSGWAASDVRWAVGAGVISGTSSGGNQYLNPKGEATRAECASMLRQFIERYL